MQTKTKRGFTLVETLFYMAGIVTLITFMVVTINYGYGWYRTTILYPRVNQDGGLIVSRIENDIRSGSSLITAQNTFNATVGSIGINGLDATETAVTYRYYLTGGRVAYQKNGGTIEYISPTNVHVSKLQFNQLTTPLSTAIRFVLEIDYKTKTGTTTNTYSSLAIMRNSY